MSRPGSAERPRRNWTRARRIVRHAVYVKAGLVFLAAVLLAAGYLRLVAGPVSLQDHAARVADALASHLGEGWTVAIGGADLELQGVRPAVRARELEIRSPGGLPVVRAPDAVVTLDPLRLLAGALVPRELELRGLQVRALVGPDGRLSFVSGGSGEAGTAPVPPPGLVPAPTPLAPHVPGEAEPSPVSLAVTSLLAPAIGPNSVVRALDRAVVTDARLSLVGPDGTERAAFSRVRAAFERGGDGERRGSLHLEGVHGPWDLQGTVREGTETAIDLAVTAVPLIDLLLLSGAPEMPGTTDLRLSGRLAGTVRGDRLLGLDATLATAAPGTVAWPGRVPVVVDAASASARWDEERRVLALDPLAFSGAGTLVRLAGELGPGPDGGWRLDLRGRDAVVAGLEPRDPAFTIADLQLRVGLGEAGIRLDRAALRGEQVSVVIAAATAPGPDGVRVGASIEAGGTEIRRFLRLWPEPLFPQVRSYLAENLRAGRVDRFTLRADLSPADQRAALRDRPVSEAALGLDFSVSEGDLRLADGVPHLRDLGIEGHLTGAKAVLTSRGGHIALPDGRRLAFSDGSYRQDFTQAGNIADIRARLSGGADALAALLRAPLLRAAGAPELDPDGIRGRFDLRIALPLDLDRPADLADLPFAATGTIADLSVEKLAGREKLEGGRFLLGFANGALSVKGEARLSGSPAQIELQRPRSGGGEATVSLTLDDAARARRFLPVAPALAGPVPVKVTVGLGAGQRGGTRLEADLGRAAIDNLLPGWTKPPGQPGKLTLALGEGEGPDLRDIVLNAGPVQLRGQAWLSPKGGLEKAELTTLKLSPGDDLRAQVERTASGWRASVRGTNLDARPILRALAAAQAGKGPARDDGDLDLDLASDIVTGHNDEALTSVSAKLATRNREIRAFRLSGRTRAGTLEAGVSRPGAGLPVLFATAPDAGAALRFLDLYRRMIGGRLTLEAALGDGVQDGTVQVDEFTLRGEPALRSMTAQAFALGEDRGAAPAERLNGSDVAFTRLAGAFRRSAGRVEFRDVAIFGPQLGFNLSGTVDFARDRTDVSGTFVPAYVLNNVFSQVPIVGAILGGGRNEGLFALEFRVSGPTSAPTLTVNPLTAVAPGILRKLFGWMLPDGAERPGTTGATRPPPIPAER